MINISYLDPENIYIELGLIKNFIKGMDKTLCGFMYLQQKFPKINGANSKEGIFVRAQIRELIGDINFAELPRDLFLIMSASI